MKISACILSLSIMLPSLCRAEQDEIFVGLQGGLIVDAVTGDWYGFENKKYYIDIKKGIAKPLD